MGWFGRDGQHLEFWLRILFENGHVEDQVEDGFYADRLWESEVAETDSWCCPVATFGTSGCTVAVLVVCEVCAADYATRPYSKAAPLRHAGEKKERSYIPYSFLNLAIDGVIGQCHPGRVLPPVKDPHLTGGWVGLWTQRLEAKSFASAGDRTAVTRSSSL
jgi:hypothetical protein